MSASEEFILAIQTGDLNYIEKHLSRPGTEINSEVKHGRNALHYAADAGKVPIVRFLLGKMAIIDYQDMDGMTPLMAAVDKDHLQTAKLLLEEVSYTTRHQGVLILPVLFLQGADPHIEDETGKTAFDIAKDHGFTQIQKFLESYKKK
ncbi:myotrophin-like isoform X1 [Montipora capricornis]|uniref:myotrophin-like isoform X1 n=1 Tax=Montipora capricornis TaxID=246305 RepID=UPI0035F16668